jgi:asparagine synthase (glutamine-hydrolysing)
MSAIWGSIDFKKRPVRQETAEILRSAFAACRIDRREELEEEGVYLACGIQYFTKEAEKEKLPARIGKCYFTADVTIENREEFPGGEDSSVPDGAILGKLLEEEAQKAPEKIIGACAALWYDAEKNEALLFSDSVGYRFVYYTVEDGVLYFSSLLEPLAKIRKNLKINERYMADYIGQDSLNAFTECEETPYEEIYRTAPAQCVRIGENLLKKEYYWDPLKKRKILRYASDEAYRDAFLKLYTKCVEQTIRSKEKTGIYLSGGYDSTSVAAFATEILEQRGERLEAYTSVPLRGCVIDMGETFETDESDAVLKTAEFYRNIHVNLCDFPEMHPWFSAPEYQKICEIPYKSPENLLWMYGIMQKAAEDGCRIILGGMFGNGTVSYDNARVYFSDLMKRGHFLRLARQINSMHEKQRYTRKSMWKTAVRDCFFTSFPDYTRIGYVRESYLKKSGTTKRLAALERKLRRMCRTDEGNHRCYITRDVFRHYGEYAQHHSLYTGVLLLDPTRDRRLVDFCMSLPSEQFTKEGVRRRMVAEYMKEMMPPHVLNNRKCGRQSADQKTRILRRKDEVLKEWLSIYRSHEQDARVDAQKAIRDLTTKDLENCEEFDLSRHIFTTCFLRYLDRAEKLCLTKDEIQTQQV